MKAAEGLFFWTLVPVEIELSTFDASNAFFPFAPEIVVSNVAFLRVDLPVFALEAIEDDVD